MKLWPFQLLFCIAIILLIVGCEIQKSEDVRIKLCREVTEHLLNDVKPITWKKMEIKIHRPAEAIITLDFTINKPGYEAQVTSSSCHYEYQIIEETVIDHVDALYAYSTLPYKMVINGKSVPADVLTKAVSEEQVRPFVEFFDSVQKKVNNYFEQ